MTWRPPSTPRIFAFLIARTTANMTRRRLTRLREPRYLIGTIVGAAYFYFNFGRLLTRNPGSRTSLSSAGLSAEVTSLLLLLASLALAIFAILSWLFVKGTPRLSLNEADVQFLLPAPLPPRAVVHFSLLRSQLRLIFGSLIAGLFFGRGISPHAWQRVAAAWIVLSALQLHSTGLAFSKAQWDEMPQGRGRILRLGSAAVAVLIGLALMGWVVDGLRMVLALANVGGISLGLVSAELSTWSDSLVPHILLAPFGALLGPAFSADPVVFLGRVPAALTVLLLLYAWVVRVSGRFEEAAVAGAQRSAERAARRSRGQVTGPAPPSRREVVPFYLSSKGIPELGIVWKNLLSRSRSRLRTIALSLALIWLALFVGALLGAGSPTGRVLFPVLALVLSLLAPLLTLTLPIGLRIDFRSDLEQASVLRSWPVSAPRLALAELVAPLIVSLVWIWGLLGALLAVLAGSQWALLRQENAGLSLTSPLRQGAGEVLSNYGIPGAVGLALFLPALAAAALVIQNAAVLAWPDWFPPGQKRVRGFEATGGRILSLFGSMVIVVVAVIPAALVGALVAWAGWTWIGAWALAPAALLASIPVWIEVAAATLLLGRLFQSFDVSAEALE
ncbi:MAG: hypothetical protein JJE39_03535 [Vicinamibacteria bacterium]|nr:hypothetical protein [Vicinamibacteria bacterium]